MEAAGERGGVGWSGRVDILREAAPCAERKAARPLLCRLGGSWVLSGRAGAGWGPNGLGSESSEASRREAPSANKKGGLGRRRVRSAAAAERTPPRSVFTAGRREISAASRTAMTPSATRSTARKNARKTKFNFASLPEAVVMRGLFILH